MNVIAVGQIQLVLACRTDDPLVRARRVRYRDIASRDFVDFPFLWGNRTMVDGLFLADGATRSVAFEVVDVHNALTLIRGGLGIGFVPDHAVAADAALAAVDLLESPPCRRLWLAVPVDRPVGAATWALHRAVLQATAN